MKAEDLDTTSEDHIADEARYACMSRPWLVDRKEDPRKGQPRDWFDGMDDEDGASWKTA